MMGRALGIIKDLWSAREPGEGFFGGAEGAIRFVLMLIILGVSAVIYLWVAS